MGSSPSATAKTRKQEVAAAPVEQEENSFAFDEYLEEILKMLPITLKSDEGKFVLIDIGHIDSCRSTFHNKSIYFPIGYTIEKTFHSYIVPGENTIYKCEIKDGTLAPLFQVTPADDPSNPVVHKSPAGAWKEVFHRLAKAINQNVDAQHLSGAAFFGLSNPSVEALIQYPLPAAVESLTRPLDINKVRIHTDDDKGTSISSSAGVSGEMNSITTKHSQGIENRRNSSEGRRHSLDSHRPAVIHVVTAPSSEREGGTTATEGLQPVNPDYLNDSTSEIPLSSHSSETRLSSFRRSSTGTQAQLNAYMLDEQSESHFDSPRANPVLDHSSNQKGPSGFPPGSAASRFFPARSPQNTDRERIIPLDDTTGHSCRSIYLYYCLQYNSKPKPQVRDSLSPESNEFNMKSIFIPDTVFIGNKGLQPLLEVARLNKSLGSFGVPSNGILNSGVEWLVHMCLHHPSIKHVDLSRNHISDPAGYLLLYLSEANPKMASIVVQETRISKHIQEAINKTLHEKQTQQITGAAASTATHSNGTAAMSGTGGGTAQRVESSSQLANTSKRKSTHALVPSGRVTDPITPPSRQARLYSYSNVELESHEDSFSSANAKYLLPHLHDELLRDQSQSSEAESSNASISRLSHRERKVTHDIEHFSTPAEAELVKGWKIGPLIGKGTYGDVYYGLLTNGRYVAVKTIELGWLSRLEKLKLFQKEISVLKSLSHPNVVSYYGCLLDKSVNTLNIFMECVSGGSMTSLLKRFGGLAEVTVQRYTSQILSGLAYCHTNGVVHRDVKGDNLLVTDSGTVKLADFGCAKRLKSSEDTRTEMSMRSDIMCTSVVGTPFFMAPEIVSESDGYSYKADIWSLGCTIIEMLTGKHPWPEFEGNHWAALYHIASSEDHNIPLPPDISDDLKSFLTLCLERDVNKRPRAYELLQHPFITNLPGSPIETMSPTETDMLSPSNFLGTPGSVRAPNEPASFTSVMSSPNSQKILPVPSTNNNKVQPTTSPGGFFQGTRDLLPSLSGRSLRPSSQKSQARPQQPATYYKLQAPPPQSAASSRTLTPIGETSGNASLLSSFNMHRKGSESGSFVNFGFQLSGPPSPTTADSANTVVHLTSKTGSAPTSRSSSIVPPYTSEGVPPLAPKK